MIKSLIIDDDPLAIVGLLEMLSKHKNIFVKGSCSSIEKAKILITELKPDLLFLDIKLEDGIAFDLLATFPNPHFHVIFVTAHDSYAIRAIKSGAFDYLLKPVDEDDLSTTLRKMAVAQPPVQQVQTIIAQECLNPSNIPNRIVLRMQNHIQVVHFANLLYCECDGNYTRFHLGDNRTITTSSSIKEYEALLPEPQFIRTHQSYIVNHQYVDRVNKDGTLILNNGLSIPVSVRRKEYVLRFFK